MIGLGGSGFLCGEVASPFCHIGKIKRLENNRIDKNITNLYNFVIKNLG